MANGDFVSKYKASKIEELLDKINTFDPSSYSPGGSSGSSTGTPGADGKSAYQLALDNGYAGTLEQWLESLKGDDGAPGTPGKNGTDGKSAYQIWLDAGNTGNESDFLNSLKGSKGDKGNPGANGTDGKSAYQLAVDNGYTGTVQQWLESLKASGSTDIKLSSLDGNILKKLADGLYAGIDFDNEFDVDYIIDMVWGKIADPSYGSSLESNYILNDDKLYRTSDNKIYNVKEAYYGSI